MDTPCGSIPDAYWTLQDRTAYGTYMGGADVPGPCKYTNGAVRVSNGFGGTPGSIVHLNEAGKTLSEVPASSEAHEGVCRTPTAAQAQLRQTRTASRCARTFNRMVTSDFLERANIVPRRLLPRGVGLDAGAVGHCARPR